MFGTLFEAVQRAQLFEDQKVFVDAVPLFDPEQIVGDFEAQSSAGVRFTMSEPWTALLLDDARVVHETTPIQPDGEGGVRDTLVVTYRANGFQDPG